MPGPLAKRSPGASAGKPPAAVNPAKVLVLGFAAAIAVGTLLLSLPWAAAPGVEISWSDALFTAVSAVCVTGLSVVDTASSWSMFGQLVILTLIHIGGLGLMTMSTVIALLLGKRITLHERLAIQTALGQISLSGMVRLARNIFLLALVLEGTGALLLTWRWSTEFPLETALWLGIFHAGSAFNNAGFDLSRTGLGHFSGDLVVVGITALLVLLGGLGFTVLVELGQWRKGWRQFSLSSKVILAGTAGLLAFGFVSLFFFEYGNPSTIGPMTLGQKIVTTFFSVISFRTAGFTIIPVEGLTVPSLMIVQLLMLIGGAPGSTAGGIKVTTAVAVLAAARATLAGQRDVVLFRRRLARSVVDRALTLSVTAFLIINILVIGLLLMEDKPLLPTMFDTVSALATTGLSLGLTAELSTAGRLTLAAAMFAGRLGPLTLAFALVRKYRGAPVLRYPEDHLMIG